MRKLATLIALAFAVLLLAAACGDGEEPAATPTPTSTVATSPTAAPTAAVPSPEPTPAEVEKPDPHTLIPPGAVLDQALEVSLDGREPGQIVVISHTVSKDESGQPVATEVPEMCDFPPSTPCDFRVEIFGYDPVSGWTSGYLEEYSYTVSAEARSFGLDPGNREALILTSLSCGANCTEAHAVLTTRDGEVEVAYRAAGRGVPVEIGPATATFFVPAYPEEPLFAGLCCPNGEFIQTVGFNEESGEVEVTEAELAICTEGTFAVMPSQRPNTLFVRCAEGEAPNVNGYETTDVTIVEPTTVAGLSGLQEGDRITVEFIIKECPASPLDCESPLSLTPVATKITVLSR